jgi:hypothetical protein
MVTRVSIAALLLSLLFADFVVGKQSERFRDFSGKGPKYSSLENLRFAASDVDYSGSGTVDIFGRSYSASTYSLTVRVTVETAEALGPTSTQVYEKRPANFEVFVVEDKDRSIHDAMVRSMYVLWKRHQLFSDEYFYDFHIGNNAYALTALPDLVNVKSFYFVWVNGRAVKVVFKGFEHNWNGGWGVMDSFTSDCFRISIDNTEFRAYEFPLQPQKRFTKLYESGFFHLSD